MEEPPEYVSERVRSRLAEDGRVNALGVEVTVRGRDVFLAGTVESAVRDALENLSPEALKQSKKVLLAIDPGKDVDGFHPDNLGRLLMGEPRFSARGFARTRVEAVCREREGRSPGG